jgi:hypothetical protein
MYWVEQNIFLQMRVVEKQKHPGCAHYISGISIALFETLEQSKQISLNCYDMHTFPNLFCRSGQRWWLHADFLEKSFWADSTIHWCANPFDVTDMLFDILLL